MVYTVCHFVCMFLERNYNCILIEHGNFTTAMVRLFQTEVWANSVDPDWTASLKEQPDHGLHCSPFCLYVFGKEL